MFSKEEFIGRLFYAKNTIGVVVTAKSTATEFLPIWHLFTTIWQEYQSSSLILGLDEMSILCESRSKS